MKASSIITGLLICCSSFLCQAVELPSWTSRIEGIWKGSQGPGNVCEVTFKIVDGKLTGNYWFIQQGQSNKTGKMSDFRFSSENALEFCWSEKIKTGFGDQSWGGKCRLSFDGDYTTFSGTYGQNDSYKGVGVWTGSNNKNTSPPVTKMDANPDAESIAIPETIALNKNNSQKNDTNSLGNEPKAYTNITLSEIKSKAEAGDAKFQGLLGNYYRRGYYVNKNTIEAEKWLTLSANNNHPYGFYGLGELRQDTNLVVRSIVGMKNLAGAGELYAQTFLGNCYMQGKGVEKDPTKAMEWYRKAADQGDAWAQCNIGLNYMNGAGVEKDSTKAIEWFRKAADQGFVLAQCILGQCYQEGTGVRRDPEKAMGWFRKAADQGNAAAQGSLGFCYFGGKGIGKDPEKAVEWFRKAADQGDEVAQGVLGFCYYHGLGVGKDPDKAVEWLRKAADKGYARAQFNLGVCYYNDAEENREKAAEWFNKALLGGVKEAAEYLDLMRQDTRLVKITIPEQYLGLGNGSQCKAWIKKQGYIGSVTEFRATFSYPSGDRSLVFNDFDNKGLDVLVTDIPGFDVLNYIKGEVYILRGVIYENDSDVYPVKMKNPKIVKNQFLL